MALIRRASRLLRADLHALLDQLEEPDTLVRQAIREMEDMLEEEDQRYKLLLHEQALLEEREQDICQSLAAGESQLDLCFETGQEALARDLIKRRLELNSTLQTLSTKHDKLVKRLSELKSTIEQNHSRLQSIRQKAELLSAEKLHEPAEGCWSGTEVRIRDQEVELEMLREKQKRGLS